MKHIKLWWIKYWILNVLGLFLLIPKLNLSQENLIVNGDCENYSSCPTNEFQIDSLLDFYNFQICGTTDYINRCSSNYRSSIPNMFGNQEPHSGDGYIHCGLVIVFPSNVNGNSNYMFNIQIPSDSGYSNYYCQSRENVIGTLSQPLEKNKGYNFEVFINFASYYPICERIALSNFNVMFLDSIFHPLDACPPRIESPEFTKLNCNPSNTIIKDTLNWVPLNVSYKAKGGEKYFAFGTFIDTTIINFVNVTCPNNFSGVASYFLDDFSLTECDTCCLGEFPYTDHLTIKGNPGSGGFLPHFEILLNPNTTATLGIYDSAGRLVFSESFHNLYTDYKPQQQLAGGVYHYRFSTSNGLQEVGKVLVVP